MARKKKGEKTVKLHLKGPAFYLILVILIAVLIIGVLVYLPSKNLRIKEGDNVQILYSVFLDDGTFVNSGVYNFTVGSEEVIDGVNANVIGMSKDETKTFKLTPDLAYGDYDPNQTVVWPLSQEIDRVFNTSVYLFNQSFGEEPALNKTYPTGIYPWNAKVIKIENETVWLEHEPKQNQRITLPYGTSFVEVTKDKVKVTLIPMVGERFTSILGPNGYPTIIDANETEMILDLNHPLAGKNLTFTITILNVEPG
jgi:FKBP-type peptidyl-prolyl cis-trans isomerase 2